MLPDLFMDIFATPQNMIFNFVVNLYVVSSVEKSNIVQC